MKRFTTILCTLALLFGVVGSANAYEPVYPVLKTYDISLDAAKWTSGWDATAANDGGNLAITPNDGFYGAKGIPLTETAATPLSSCNKICVVIESYSGGWGQLIAKSGGVNKAVTGIGTVSGEPKTFILEYNPADNIDEFDIQCSNSHPTVTVSRVYLVEKAERMPGTRVYTYDYDGKTEFPWYHDDGWGTKPTVSDVLTATNESELTNAHDYQFFVADLITTNESKEYYVRATIKGSVAGSIVCNLGTWGKSTEKSLSFTTEYQDVDILLSGLPTANNSHVVFKIGKFVGTVSLKKIEVYEALGANVIKVGDAGFTTFSSDNAFATSDIVTAYAAKYQGGHVVLTPVTEIPANEGVIVEAAEGTYKVPVIESAAALGSINELLVSDGSILSDGTHHFALGKKGDVVGFVKVKNGVTIPKGKAYLYIATPPSARDFIGFGEDDVTGIDAVKQETKADNQYFNLAGQRVAQPTKGLYIVNGKKVIIK